MATKAVLIIDDEEAQAKALALKLREKLREATFFVASKPEEIEDAIENKFYNLVILDIRMDGYKFDGIALANKIIDINPFAKIIFVSRFVAEYLSVLQPLMSNGKILGFSEKKEYNTWIPELLPFIEDYYTNLEQNPFEVNNALIQYYAEAKNETDTYSKGIKFENFITILFRSIGFKEILKRVKDKSLNEVDLILRNDIDDNFLAKFGKYILVECKNKPENKADKNDFIIFFEKLRNTNGLAELGFLFTTSSLTKNTYIEAARTSSDKYKIVVIDNQVMSKLLSSVDLKEGLKKIIDSQVKDN